MIPFGNKNVFALEIEDAGPFPNYYKNVVEQKEITRIFMGLQGAMFLLQPDVVKLLEVITVMINRS